MDAHAILRSQGWRGTGHSLHPISDNTGLAKPLLISRKHNNLGVGKKQTRTSDMWWMNAFDKTLKGLDTTKTGVVVQTVTNGALDMVTKGGARYVGNSGGLYASFVRGECLSGTITPEETPQESKDMKGQSSQERKETKEERSARKLARRERRERRARRAKDSLMKQERMRVKDKTKDVKKSEDADLQLAILARVSEEASKRKTLKKSLQQVEQDESKLTLEKPRKKKRRKQ